MSVPIYQSEFRSSVKFQLGLSFFIVLASIPIHLFYFDDYVELFGFETFFLSFIGIPLLAFAFNTSLYTKLDFFVILNNGVLIRDRLQFSKSNYRFLDFGNFSHANLQGTELILIHKNNNETALCIGLLSCHDSNDQIQTWRSVCNFINDQINRTDNSEGKISIIPERQAAMMFVNKKPVYIRYVVLVIMGVGFCIYIYKVYII